MRAALAIEFLLIFIALPGALAIDPLPWWPLPVLWVLAVFCYWLLRRRPGFDPRKFWSAKAIAEQAGSILALFVPTACVFALAVYELAPKLLFSLPRQRPLYWCLAMLLYPVFSVAPQTLVYRAFFFRRYRPLFASGWLLVLVSGVSFSWMHIVLRNPVAPLLTLPGGLLFAWRYARTGSLLASALEHALYGCLVFTVGLGVYFYS